MARYQYTGPHPVVILSEGEIIRPGDVREFDEAPDWGPWQCIDPPPEPEPAAAPVTPFTAPPATPEGM